MAKEIQWIDTETGLTTIKAVIGSPFGQRWNGSALVDLVVANFATYGFTLVESEAGSYTYFLNFPANIVVPGEYDIWIFKKVGALVAADAANPRGHGTILWNGLTVVSAAHLHPMVITIGETADQIREDTIEIGPEGSGLFSIPWNPAWDNEFQGAGGEGPRTVTITVNDGTDPLQNAHISMTEGVNVFTLTTNVNGVATFNLEDATYTVAIAKSGYSFGGASLIVNGNETQTYSMTQTVIPGSSNPATTNAYVYARLNNGDPDPGRQLWYALTDAFAGNADTYTISPQQTSEADVTGLIQVELLRNSTYDFWRGPSQTRKVLVATGNGSALALPEILGEQ